ncbi:uncharacterized protein LOC135143663 isoform X2 [Zophobas morio]|uniref:uncharacterized protein LOC135143663 isoform X2 n=1 Tax=Zophobas morio TaxID=2755281 RepID=UPI003082FD5A
MIKALKEKQLLMVKSEQEDKHLANKYMILVKDRDFSSNDEIINTLNYLSYQEIGYFADACRALPVHCANKKLWGLLGDRVVSYALKLQPQQLSKVCQAFAYAGFKHDLMLAALKKRAHLSHSDYTPLQGARVMWTLYCFKEADKKLYYSMSRTAVSGYRDAAFNTLVTMCLLYAKARFPHPALANRTLKRLSMCAHCVHTDDLVDGVYALAFFRPIIKDPESHAKLLNELTERSQELTPEHIYALCLALPQLKISAHALLCQLQYRVAELKLTFPEEQLSAISSWYEEYDFVLPLVAPLL